MKTINKFWSLVIMFTILSAVQFTYAQEEWPDEDGDGYNSMEDCDDSNPAINPGATEICDGIDNDCDGWVDADDPGCEGTVKVYPDSDGDGKGSLLGGKDACPGNIPSGYVTDNTDECDNDPSTSVKKVMYKDADEDGKGREPGITKCKEPGWVEQGGDECDNDPNAFTKKVLYRDGDGDGHGREPGVNKCPEPGWVELGDDECDQDPNYILKVPLYRDHDKDGVGVSADMIIGCPNVYPKRVQACCDANDNDPNVQRSSGEGETGNLLLDIYPNPASRQTTVTFILEEDELVTFIIYNSLGEVVHAENFAAVSGTNVIPISIGNMNSGLYFLEIKSGYRSVRSKLFVRN